jgi:DNA-binding PadR family transcriptional regulator
LARKEPGRTRERTVYELTAKGLAALREYAQTSVTFTPLKSDPLLRLLICDLVGEDVTRESIATRRKDLADIGSRLDGVEKRAHDFPHREKYLLIVSRFLRGLVDLHEDLVEDVERELTGRSAPSSARPATRPIRARGTSA